MMKKMNARLAFVAAICLSGGCGSEWLDAKRDLATVVPSSLADYRAVLNSSFAPSLANDYIGMSLESADEYETEEGNLYSVFMRNLYSWQESLYDDPLAPVQEWNQSYQQVFTANVAITGVRSLTRDRANGNEWDAVLGGGLFFRAKAYYNLLQLFAPVYDAGTARDLPGIPLRQVPVAEGAIARSSLEACYRQVLEDLSAAARLLPVAVEHRTIPSKQAAYGLLARVYLSMSAYAPAAAYADSCLAIQSALLDYNSVEASSAGRVFPFDEFNAEVIFHGTVTPLYNAAVSDFSTVPHQLRSVYMQDDLRNTLFFDDDSRFVGNYTGNERRFSGISTGEVMLVGAEAKARLGRDGEARAALETLLSKRMEAGTFTGLPSLQGEGLLDAVLTERLRELPLRGLRWTDLRRLNPDPRTSKSISRTMGGLLYRLGPNDPRYVFPIPDYIVQSSGIAQNDRSN